jgi:hypothetical protein
VLGPDHPITLHFAQATDSGHLPGGDASADGPSQPQ